jgi:hypothetical protein
MTIGIYKIESKRADFVYIGGSANIDERWATHQADLRYGVHHCLKLTALYMLDKELTYSVLETCTEYDLKERENFWFAETERSGKLLLNTRSASSFSSCSNPEKLKARFLAKVASEVEKKSRTDKLKHEVIKTYAGAFTNRFTSVDGAELRDLITVVNHKRLNKQLNQHDGYTTSGFANASDEMLDKVRRNISNFFINIAKTNSRYNLWTTYSGVDYTDYKEDHLSGVWGKGESKKVKSIKDFLERAPYKTVGVVKNKDPESEEFAKAQCFLAVNARATNLYGDRTALAYMANLHIPPNIKRFFQSTIGEAPSDDQFATHALVQWVFRSAIRNNQPIIIYIPSRRMRHLLLKWLGYTDSELF